MFVEVARQSGGTTGHLMSLDQVFYHSHGDYSGNIALTVTAKCLYINDPVTHRLAES